MTAEDAAAGGLGPTVPSWALRVITGVAGLGTVAAAGAWASPPLFALVLLAGLAVVAAGFPASHWPTALLTGFALLVLASADGVTIWTVPTVLGVHATHVLASLTAVVSADAAVERAALRPSLERFVPVQAGSQVLVLLAWLVTRG